jgi:signal transduction histidine kinase
VKALVHSRWSPWLATAFALALLSGAIALTQRELRGELRSQLAHRDGNLFALLVRQQLKADGAETVVDPLTALLDTARLPELPGLQTLSLYDHRGRLTGAIPATAAETELTPAALAAAQSGEVFAQLNLRAALATETILPSAEHAPLLEVVFLLDDPLGGRASFVRLLLDGSGLAQEFQKLDASLWRQGLIAFLLAGTAMATALALAFRRLQRVNRRLQQTNAQLALAAKTSAVGAVTSHLVHGLNNPLAGLHGLVSSRAANGDPADWNDVAETTRRMRALIEGVLRVLRNHAETPDFELPVSDALSSLLGRLRPAAQGQGTELELEVARDVSVCSHEAELLSLIVENLVMNALQALGQGGAVRIRVEATDTGTAILVADNGPGLPEHVVANLFSPHASTKAGGSGLGLALSRQIATGLGATLELVSTGSRGTTFALGLPRDVSASAAD